MKAIVVVDKYWGIGKKNDLLFSLKEDMKHFRQHTLNKVVIMGRNTLKSLPNGAPLKNRTSIILTSEKSGADNGREYICCAGLDELFETLKQFNTDDVFVAGGATVYKTLLPYCNEVIVTKVDSDGGAEVFFPNLDEDKNFECANVSEPVTDGQHTIRFCSYIRR